MEVQQFFKGLFWTTVFATVLIFVSGYWPLIAGYRDFGWVCIAFFVLWSAVMFFSIHKKDNSKPYTFINAVMVFTMGKLILSAVLIVVYFKVTEPASKIFILPFFATYIIYTIFETRFMMKLGRR